MTPWDYLPAAALNLAAGEELGGECLECGHGRVYAIAPVRGVESTSTRRPGAMTNQGVTELLTSVTKVT